MYAESLGVATASDNQQETAQSTQPIASCHHAVCELEDLYIFMVFVKHVRVSDYSSLLIKVYS